MRHIAINSFKVAIAVTGMLLAVAAIIAIILTADPPDAKTLPLLRFELDMFKTILAGFVVGMLGILIPAVASEAKQRFEQRKESRLAYSEAKTGIDYLKLRLASANLSEATAAVQAVHLRKHTAELYDDFPEWLQRRYKGKISAEDWDDMMYKRLFGARKILEENSKNWDKLSPEKRIALLEQALPTKSEIADQHPPTRR